MKNDNIFYGISAKANVAKLIYELLMSRDEITYQKIIAKCEKKDLYDKRKLKDSSYYETVKHVFPKIISLLKEKDPNCIKDNGKTKGVSYWYVGKAKDPLYHEIHVAEEKTIDDYYSFCLDSASFFPISWMRAFFKDTQLLYDATQKAKNGEVHLQSFLVPELKRIELLPWLNKAIKDKKVLSFSYRPFGADSRKIILHPQFLKEYNCRWFVFGHANIEPYDAVNIPLDRIQGDIEEVEDIEYVEAPKNFYTDFFKHRVGVSASKFPPKRVVLRTLTAKRHGLIMTKPIVAKMKEVVPFGEHEDGTYGEISFSAYLNVELKGILLSFGNSIQVLAPSTLRKWMYHDILDMKNYYDDLADEFSPGKNK